MLPYARAQMPARNPRVFVSPCENSFSEDRWKRPEVSVQQRPTWLD